MPTSVRGQNQQLDPLKLKAAIRRLDEQLTQAGENAKRLQERDRKFVELEGVLEGLPDKVTHPVMVPFGPLAFFEGHLEHTNEVLVQLSSDWFALKTAKHALGTVARRRQRLRSELQNVEQEKQELQHKKRLASSEGAAVGIDSCLDPDGLLDIREPLDGIEEDAERTRTCGIPGVTVSRDADGYLDIREPLGDNLLNLQNEATLDSDLKASHNDRQQANDGWNWPRLRELERLEDEGKLGDEEPISREDIPRDSCDDDRPNLDRLSELERLERLEELEQLDNLIDSYERTGAPPSTNSLTVPCSTSESLCETKIKSPADIYELMSRSDGSSSSAPRLEDVNERQKSQVSAPPSRTVSDQAFSGEIRENISPSSTFAQCTLGSSDVKPATSSDGQQRISKFKADRQRSNR